MRGTDHISNEKSEEKKTMVFGEDVGGVHHEVFDWILDDGRYLGQ